MSSSAQKKRSNHLIPSSESSKTTSRDVSFSGIDAIRKAMDMASPLCVRVRSNEYKTNSPSSNTTSSSGCFALTVNRKRKDSLFDFKDGAMGALLDAVGFISQSPDSINYKRPLEPGSASSEQLTNPIKKAKTSATTIKPSPETANKKQLSRSLPMRSSTNNNNEKIPSKSSFRPTPRQTKIALEAAEIAGRLILDKDASKQLCLHMALTAAPSITSIGTHVQRQTNLPPPGPVPIGFCWSNYPPLDQLLRRNMQAYYHYSGAAGQGQTRAQHEFNQTLAADCVCVAAKHGWSFQLFSTNDIRNRVRCYYKTHVQNCKKRLVTMLRMPLKRANVMQLMELATVLKEMDNQSVTVVH
jgi:hypothetical protein